MNGKLMGHIFPIWGFKWDFFDVKMGLVALSQFWEIPIITQQIHNRYFIPKLGIRNFSCECYDGASNMMGHKTGVAK